MSLRTQVRTLTSLLLLSSHMAPMSSFPVCPASLRLTNPHLFHKHGSIQHHHTIDGYVIIFLLVSPRSVAHLPSRKILLLWFLSKLLLCILLLPAGQLMSPLVTSLLSPTPTTYSGAHSSSTHRAPRTSSPGFIHSPTLLHVHTHMSDPPGVLLLSEIQV